MSGTTSGILFVFSAPSGAGKTSLLKELVPTDENLLLSVSHTTRPQRPGEDNGVHYHFVAVSDFEAMIGQGTFLEHARVFDNYYGTSEAAVREQLSAGRDVVLEIDWQGAQQVRRRFPDAVSIFIAPPSVAALRTRLTGRGQDSPQVIERRMADARGELSHFSEYDYLVINDQFEDALADLQAIVGAERLRLARQAERHRDDLSEMLKEG